MPVSLGHSLNKAVSISIPLLFGDDLPHVCTLVGIDAGGVWLQIADPGFKLFQTDKTWIAAAKPNVFVPFAQIAYLLDSTVSAASSGPSGQPTSPSSEPNPAVETRPERKKESKTK
jgi:hypothetical protein